MNVAQWITVVAGSLTFVVTIYWLAVTYWLLFADLSKDYPWWVLPAVRVVGK